MAVRDLKSVIYTDDLGNEYATKIDAAVFSQVNGSSAILVGGSDYTGSPPLPPLPRNLKPRTVKVSASGNKRRVVCLENTSVLYQGTETSINLQVLGASAAAYTRYGRSPERYSIEHDPSQ